MSRPTETANRRPARQEDRDVTTETTTQPAAHTPGLPGLRYPLPCGCSPYVFVKDAGCLLHAAALEMFESLKRVEATANSLAIVLASPALPKKLRPGFQAVLQSLADALVVLDKAEGGAR